MASTPDSETPVTQQYVDFDEYVDFHVAKTRTNIKRTEIFTALIWMGTLFLLYLLAFVVLDQWVIAEGFSIRTRAIMLTVIMAVEVFLFVRSVLLPSLKTVNALYAARIIESAEPGLKSNLVNFVDLQSSGMTAPQNMLRAMEKRAAVELSHIDVDHAVDHRPLLRILYTLLVVGILSCLYIVLSPKDVFVSLRRALLPATSVAVATQTTISEVTPGDDRVPARGILTVEADIRGKLPERVNLSYTTADHKFVDQVVEMRRIDEASPRFRGVINGENGRGLLQSLTYMVVAGDARSPQYSIQVIQPPSAKVEELHYTFPSYMELAAKTQPGGEIDGWEGATLQLRATTNMPVKAAKLVFTDTDELHAKGEEMRLQIVDGTKLAAEWKLAFRSDGTFPRFYHIECTTPKGETDPDPTQYGIKIRPDLPPEIALLAPTGDLELPANGVVPIVVQAADPDFLLRLMTLRAEQNGEPLVDQRLFEDQRLGQAFRGAYDFALEPLKLKPGSTIQFWVEAKDNKQPIANRKNTPRLNIKILAPVSPQESKQQLAAEKQKQQDQLASANDAQNAEGKEKPEGMRDSPAEEKNRDEKNPKDPESREPRQTPAQSPDEKANPPEENASEKKKTDGQDDADVLKELLKPKEPKPEKSNNERESPDTKKESKQDEQKANQKQSSESESQQGSGGDKGSEKKGSNSKKSDANSNSPQKSQQSKNSKDKSAESQPGKSDKADSKKGQADKPGSEKAKSGGDKQAAGEKNPSPEKSGAPNKSGNKDNTLAKNEPRNAEKPEGESGKQDSAKEGGKQEQMPADKPSDAGKSTGKEGEKPAADKSPASPDKPGGEKGADDKDKTGKPTKEPSSSAKDDKAAEAGGEKKSGDRPQPAGEKKSEAYKNEKQVGEKMPDKEGKKDGVGEKSPEKSSDDKRNPPEKSEADKGEAGKDEGKKDDAGKSDAGKSATDKKEAGKEGSSDKPMPGEAGGAKKGEQGQPDKSAMPPGGGESSEKEKAPPKSGGDKPGKSDSPPEPGAKERPAEDSPDAKKQQATGDEKGEGTADKKPEGNEPKAKDGNITRKPGTEPGKSQPKTNENQPSKDKSAPKPGAPDEKGSKNNSSSNPDNAKPAPDRKTDQPSGEKPDNPSGKQSDKTQNPAEKQGGQPNDADEKMQGKGRPEGQKSDQPQKGEAGGSSQDKEGNKGGQDQGAGDKSKQPGDSDKAGNEKGKESSGQGKPSKSSDGQAGKSKSDSGESSSSKSGKSSKPGEGSKSGGEGEGKPSESGKPGGEGQSGGEGKPGGQGEPSTKGSKSPEGGGAASSKPGTQDKDSATEGGGASTGNAKANGTTTGEEASGEAEKANLEYAKKATNLLLKRLQDQLDRGEVDQEMLDKLGWTRDDMQKFADRLKKQLETSNNSDDNSPEALAQRLRFEETLKNLELGNTPKDRLADKTRNRRAGKVGTSQLPVPAEYREQYEAYTRGLSKQGTTKSK